MSEAAALRKIQALLDKAASTTFPEEAEALLAKAQELMSRDAIDHAMLAADGRRAIDVVISRELSVEPPYAGARAALLGSVLRANHCRLVLLAGGRGTQRCTVVGHRSDIEKAESLYQALSIQAIREMTRTVAPPGEGTRAFRHAFLLAFAWRIGDRLQRAARAAEAAASVASPTGSVALVLASRSAEVDERLHAEFPHLRRQRRSVSSAAGLASGRAAADRAALGEPRLAPSRVLPR